MALMRAEDPSANDNVKRNESFHFSYNLLAISSRIESIIGSSSRLTKAMFSS